MNKPLISIIIPVYNVEEYVEKCVKTVCAQTYENLEILIVDDGSTDNSGKICDALAKTDERIRVFHLEHSGVGITRNFGIDQITGEYVGFVDSDDFIEPDMYEFLYNKIVENSVEIAVCAFYFYKNGISTFSKKHTIEEKVYSRKECLEKIMADKILNNHLCNKLFKSTLFKGLRFPDSVYEDIALTSLLVERSENLALFSRSPKYHYRQREGSITNSRTWESHLAYFNAEFFHLSFLYEKGFPDAARHLCRRGIHTIKRLIRSNVSDEIIREILQRLEPFDFIGFKELGF